MPVPPVWSYALVADDTLPETLLHAEVLYKRQTVGECKVRVGSTPKGMRQLISESGGPDVYDAIRINRILEGLVYFNNAGLDDPNISVTTSLAPSTASSELLMESQVLGEPLGNPHLYEGNACIQVGSGNSTGHMLSLPEAGYLSTILAGEEKFGVPQVSLFDDSGFGWLQVSPSSTEASLSWDFDTQGSAINVDVQSDSRSKDFGYGSTQVSFSNAQGQTEAAEFYFEATWENEPSTNFVKVPFYIYSAGSWEWSWQTDLEKFSGEPMLIKHYGAQRLRIQFVTAAEGSVDVQWRHLADPA